MVTGIVAVGTAAVLWFGARLVLQGAMTAGALVVFMTYLSKLFRPIEDLARLSTNVAQAAVGLERVRAILDTDERLPRSATRQVLEQIQGRIEAQGVTFGYDAARPVLKDVSFVVEPGQRVGLVGRSGSGKSTLASLLARFYDPTAGAITLDGIDLRQLGVRALRRRYGFVLQDTALFYAPVWQNIAYGKPAATREEIVAAAKLANADDFITALPEGYDTVIGQGGMNLSGGQRQRIGIARAMIRDAAVLILDEPTSGLDLESERLVFEALARLLTGKTTFIIAHRLSTIRDADLILVLDHGRIAERGTHRADGAQRHLRRAGERRLTGAAQPPERRGGGRARWFGVECRVAAKTTAAALAWKLLAAAMAEGVDASQLLPFDLPQGASGGDLETRVPHEQLVALWEKVMRAIRDPGFPVRAGERSTPREYDAIGFACMTRATLGDALEQLVRFSRIWSNAGEWRVRREPGTSALELDLGDPHRLGERCGSESTIARLVTAGRFLTDSDLVPVAVRFRHAAPHDTSAHERVFRAPIEWRASRTELVLTDAMLDLPLIKADPGLAAFFERHAEEMLGASAAGDRAARRRRVVADELRPGVPSLETTAARLAWRSHPAPTAWPTRAPPPEGHRRGALRAGAAVPAQRRPGGGRGGFLLGFSEPSPSPAPSKRWTGKTPLEFRVAA